MCATLSQSQAARPVSGIPRQSYGAGAWKRCVVKTKDGKIHRRGRRGAPSRHRVINTLSADGASVKDGETLSPALILQNLSRLHEMQGTP